MPLAEHEKRKTLKMNSPDRRHADTAMSAYAFDAVVAGNCVFFLILAIPCIPVWQNLSWVASWLLLHVFSRNVFQKKLHWAAIVFLASFTAAIPWLLNASTDMQLFWLLIWICVLLVIWPLRFLALGEVTTAAIFGLGFWVGSFSLMEGSFDSAPLALLGASQSPMPAGRLCGIFAWLSFLVLFAESFLRDISLYEKHKELQHYSLPVLLGNLMPSIDRLWAASPLLKRWMYGFATLYFIAGILLLAFFL